MKVGSSVVTIVADHATPRKHIHTAETSSDSSGVMGWGLPVTAITAGRDVICIWGRPD
jgi:hypothetical protein